MKDYSQYSYSELYDMLDHVNYYKYPDKIERIEEELRSRKEKGEIPERMIPSIRWSDLKFWRKASSSSS